MKKKDFSEISERIKNTSFEKDFDLVVGIASGGIVPAYLVSRHLNLPLEFIWINFRDRHHKPKREAPELVKPFTLDVKGKKVLLVDDRTNTGLSLRLANICLEGAEILTLVINGKGDYSLYDEDCFSMPWEI